MKTNFLKLNKIKLISGPNFNIKVRGFTMGLALVIVASMLLISVSISTILIRDLKNSAANEKSVIAYNLAESALECIVSHENNIRYFDTLGNNITGLFPISLNYRNTSDLYSDSSKDLPKAEGFSGAQDGYAYKNYVVGENDNKFFAKKDVRCFGNEILTNINPSLIPTDDKVYTTLKSATSDAPSGYYSVTPALNGVVTSIKIKTDVNYGVLENVTTQKLFSEYLQNSCVDINIYAAPEGSTYKKLISAEASVPCTGKNLTKRVLVRYIQ